MIAELASQQTHDDASTDSAATKPRGRKANSLQKKEVSAAHHPDIDDGEQSTKEATPRPRPEILQPQNRTRAAIESGDSAHPHTQQLLSTAVLDAALEAEGRKEARQSSRSTKQRDDRRHGERTERTPLSDRPKRDTLPGSRKKVRDGTNPSSHRGSTSKPPTESDAPPKPDRKPRNDLPTWATQKHALSDKFGSEGWNPRRKLSPDAMLGIRNMHQTDPLTYTTPVLAKQFKVSAEAIRRILKSKWLVNSGADKMQERRERWAKRHDQIWDQQSALGLRPGRQGGQQMRVRDAAEGADEVEEELWAKETLEKAREENPLWP